MPTLSRPVITATIAPNRQVDIRVTGRLAFSAIDRALMRLGMVNAMSCRMRGDDDSEDPKDLDDPLPGVVFAPTAFTFTGEQPTSVGYEFTARVDSSELDEDKPGLDEVFALVLVSNDLPVSFVERASANIVAEFGDPATAAA